MEAFASMDRNRVNKEKTNFFFIGFRAIPLLVAFWFVTLIDGDFCGISYNEQQVGVKNGYTDLNEFLMHVDTLNASQPYLIYNRPQTIVKQNGKKYIAQ